MSARPAKRGAGPAAVLSARRSSASPTRSSARPAISADAGPIDYRAHSQRKSQGLLELSRLEPNLAGVRVASPRARRARRASRQARRQPEDPARPLARRAHDRGSGGARDPRRPVGRHLFRADLAGEPAMIKTLFVAIWCLPGDGRRELRRHLRDEDASGEGDRKARRGRASRRARAASSTCRSSATAR